MNAFEITDTSRHPEPPSLPAAVADVAVPAGVPLIIGDPRVTAAADLLAERHQPSALSAAQLRGRLAIYDRRLRALLDVVTAAPAPYNRLQRLQALEDALKYRRARIIEPCADCDAVPAGRCDDHGRDVDLIGEYEQAARRLGAGATS
jgi:hypothetical protein